MIYYNEKNPDWKSMYYKKNLYAVVKISDNNNNVKYAVFDNDTFEEIQEINKKLFINKNEVSYIKGKIEKLKNKLDLDYEHYNDVDYDFRKANLNYDGSEISENKIKKLKKEYDLLVKTAFQKPKKEKSKKEADFYYTTVSEEELNDIFD